MRPRRKAREMALQALYTIDLLNAWEAGDPAAFLYDIHLWPRSGAYARRVVKGVCENRSSVDRAIQTHAREWSIPRMNVVDRNILRIGSFELLHQEDVPTRVSINEALELAKTYGSPETRRFLNGILDKIGRSRPRARPLGEDSPRG